MIPALNELRRTLGLPTVPTLTGRRRASLKALRWWRHSVRVACYEFCAEQRGRMVRMEQAVILGWVHGMTHNTKREET